MSFSRLVVLSLWKCRSCYSSRPNYIFVRGESCSYISSFICIDWSVTFERPSDSTIGNLVLIRGRVLSWEDAWFVRQHLELLRKYVVYHVKPRERGK
jgi:hypothetical protein